MATKQIVLIIRRGISFLSTT